jgi:low affinity Fe/Cu permease
MTVTPRLGMRPTAGRLDDRHMRESFRRLAGLITTAVGTPWALLLAIGIVAVWALSGPLFGFSDTWQLAINTGTTVVTFLMVFVIQASQNREAKATQLKLDELIRAVRGARNELIDLENAPDEAVELHKEQFRELVAAAQASDPDVMDGIEVSEAAGMHQADAPHAAG